MERLRRPWVPIKQWFSGARAVIAAIIGDRDHTAAQSVQGEKIMETRRRLDISSCTQSRAGNEACSGLAW